MLDNVSNNLKSLIKSASEVTITTERTVLVLPLIGNKVVTNVYESASLKKVAIMLQGVLKNYT
jgi:hypothetical protein